MQLAMIKKRLAKDRLMTSITLRIPVDVLKAYLSEGLRRDEADHAFGPAAKLVQTLKKLGVSARKAAQDCPNLNNAP